MPTRIFYKGYIIDLKTLLYSRTARQRRQHAAVAHKKKLSRSLEKLVRSIDTFLGAFLYSYWLHLYNGHTRQIAFRRDAETTTRVPNILVTIIDIIITEVVSLQKRRRLNTIPDKAKPNFFFVEKPSIITTVRVAATATTDFVIAIRSSALLGSKKRVWFVGPQYSIERDRSTIK